MRTGFGLEASDFGLRPEARRPKSEGAEARTPLHYTRTLTGSLAVSARRAGIGTIIGALLGALVMQSLVSGMVLMGVEAPLQDIVVGIVLVLAVTLDTIVRRRSAK